MQGIRPGCCAVLTRDSPICLSRKRPPAKTMPNKHLSKPQRFYASDTGKVIDEDYLDFIRAKPCVGCGKRPAEADHLVARGMGSGKRNDYYCLPMCRQCHNERHTEGNSWFEMEHAVLFWRQCAFLLAEYLVALKKKGER